MNIIEKVGLLLLMLSLFFGIIFEVSGKGDDIGAVAIVVLLFTIGIVYFFGSDILKKMIENTRHNRQLRALLLDGVALGGFNIVDIEDIYDTTGLPVITITRDKPNFDKIKHALEKNFDDWEDRWNMITKGELHEVKTKHNPIFVKCVGIDIEEAKEIIKLSTIRGVIPEPIRVAHLIASGITRGESYGKA